jgi:hypothetical protein
VKVAVAPGSGTTDRQIWQYQALLEFIFDRVSRLGRPSALPGFFNGTDVVTVIDARVDYGDRDGFRAPYVFGDPGMKHISFVDSAWEALRAGIPRVWLIRATPSEREQLISELNDKFDRPTEHQLSPVRFDSELPSLAQRVEYVAKDYVTVWRPKFKPSPDMSISDRMTASIAFSEEHPNEYDPFYTIRSEDGIADLLTSLKSQLESIWHRENEFM